MEETREQDQDAHPSDSRNGRAPIDPSAPPGQGLKDALAQLAELQEYIGHYLIARIDQAKLSIRETVVWLGMWAMMGVAGIALVITAAVLLTMGLAQGISTLLGTGPWAGNLIVGVLLLGAVLGGGWLMGGKFSDLLRSRTVARYERRLKKQRVLHGHDAHERSRQADDL